VNLGEGAAKDFVFRGPGVRRLTAEQFRDALGQITGVWFDKADFAVTKTHVRACLVGADPLTSALGRPNREQVMTTRASAATTLQALELTNGETLAKLLDKGAQKLVSNGAETHELIRQLYREAFGRPPTSSEQTVAAEVLSQPAQQAGVEDLLWAMVMLPEFQLIY
jgi:hypothetical protein